MGQTTVMKEEPVFKLVQEGNLNVLKASYGFKQLEEYQKAKENGFKGTIEDYLSVRDYT